MQLFSWQMMSCAWDTHVSCAPCSEENLVAKVFWGVLASATRGLSREHAQDPTHDAGKEP
eukprot:2790505-Amphidinium_carterae.1